MAERRPITAHPAFAPLITLWFAALLGLVIAVLPAPLVERGLSAAGVTWLVPLTTVGRLLASGGAALLGALLGIAVALPLSRRGRDPRPLYAEPDPPVEHFIAEEPARRPLRVHEELAERAPAPPGDQPPLPTAAPPEQKGAESEEGFMILTPQPIHPPRPALDIDSLLDQFDTALAAFRSGEDTRPVPRAGGPDPVHAFVERQTGTPVSAAPNPTLGGPMPDHQAELRAALDKLARAHRKD